MTEAQIEPASMQRRFRFHIPMHRITAAWRSLCDWLKWLGHKPGNLETFARRELELAGYFSDEGMYGDMMGVAVMRMIREFSDEGHSGMSAGFAISIFSKVSRFQPLTPLTGADDEWMSYAEGHYQNRRCFHVFQDADQFDGQAYDSEAVVFEDEDGSRFTNRESRRVVTFPYVPESEIVKIGGGPSSHPGGGSRQ